MLPNQVGLQNLKNWSIIMNFKIAITIKINYDSN